MSVFSKQQDCECCVTSKTGFASPKELQDIVIGLDPDTQYSSISQDKLYDGPENYIRLQQDDGNNPVIAILNKIQTGNKQLAEIANVNQGILSGADKVSDRHITKYSIAANKDDGIFVFNNQNVNDINTLKKFLLSSEKDLIKPFFKNSDVHRFYTEEQCNNYIVYLDRHHTLKTDSVIYEHLLTFEPVLRARREVLNGVISFYQLQWPREMSIFNGPKIVAPQRSARNTFGYNEIPWYAASDVFFITAPRNGYDLKYILGLLNSKLYFYLGFQNL